MEKYRVMIVDDQSISRHLFEMYVNNSPSYELAFSLSSASAADVYILRHEVDLILMDILMNDGSNGLEAAEKIKKLRSDIKMMERLHPEVVLLTIIFHITHIMTVVFVIDGGFGVGIEVILEVLRNVLFLINRDG